MLSALDRRRFLSFIGLGGAGLAAACAQPAPRPAVAPISADHVRATAAAAVAAAPTASVANGQHTAGQVAGGVGQHKAEDMDALHAKGVKAFPAKTEGLGNQRLAHTLDGDVKVFELTCQKVQWEVEPGRRVDAWTYNGVVPGPEIRVTEGDKVRVHVTNQLEESTSVHWHGLYTPNKMDGVPFITQEPIKPGERFTYEFVAKPAGSHMYHSHHNAAVQVTMGLLGAFIVEPKDPALRPKVDHDYPMILNDGPLGFTLNGKSFPATAPLTAKVGQKVLVRYMNEGLMIHPMHLHGMGMLVTHKDGYPLPQPFMCDTLNIAPGERYDAVIDCQEPGVWAFHCHILTHAESPGGMFGMVTALIIEA
jgi:FtsP/CotA-like multicopper oxidase with cupredoxin domain